MKVAIIGAGLVGRILAWRLHELDQGFNITLIDQHDASFVGTGLVAAAMVAPYSEAVTTEAVTQEIGSRSYKLWSTWLPQLEAKTGIPITFNQKGSLIVSHAQDNADWQRFHLKAKTMISDTDMQELTHRELNILEPELAQVFSKSLYFPDEGAINNLALYPALNDYFKQSKNIRTIENTSINHFGSDGYITELNETFNHVFDCRGNGAKTDLSQFRSVRGEVARVYAPEVNISRAVRLIHPRFPLYIAPRDNHEYIIGATQLESDANTPVTVRSGLELLSALYCLHQGFGEAQIIQLMAGLRPAFMDNLPRVETDNKLTRINGLYRHGYLFTPALINDLLRDAFCDFSSHDKDILFPQFISSSSH